MLEPRSYLTLDAAGVRAHLERRPALAARLGGAPAAWSVREVSDGNLNSVFLVDGPAGGLCVKQSLPHVRVAPAWKLPLDRAFFEAAYLRATAPHARGAAPALLDYDPDQFCLVLEQLTPHVILRQGLIERRVYPRMAADLGRTVARICFATSFLARPFEAVMDDIALFAANQTLTRITVDLVLADPYRDSPRNRWTRPWLDDLARDLTHDAALRGAARRMGARFLGCPQALLHGDLHSGSVMVTADDTRIIDGEFALFGPIGFDLGLFVGNLLLNLFSQPRNEAGIAYAEWVISQIGAVWHAFADTFLGLWSEAGAAGDMLPDASAAEREAMIAEIYEDMVGFAGMEMIRRVVGFAHVQDLEAIEDARARAAAERACLRLARRLLVERAAFGSIERLIQAVRGALHTTP